jgi:hypothetical protein
MLGAKVSAPFKKNKSKTPPKKYVLLNSFRLHDGAGIYLCLCWLLYRAAQKEGM